MSVNVHFGIIALIAVIGFSFAACNNGGAAVVETPDLSGTVTISPSSGVVTGTELTAAYDGSEDVSYQWKKGSADVGTDSVKYTPSQAGSYTVTVSAEGYNSKTSAAVAVTAPVVVVTPDLPGTVIISPDTGVVTGTEMTAVYNGSEAVNYQWKKGTANVGLNSNKYTPSQTGSYTVTVSAEGYNSKTSAAVAVAAPVVVVTPDLPGTVTISPDTGVVTGTEMTAVYSGNETVRYQWKKGTSNVGLNSRKYTPSQAGSYTVTVSAEGYNSKTSAAVAVAAPAAVNIAAITGITVPVTGGTCVTRITDNEQFSGTVSWSPGVSSVFAVATQYTATITLTAKSGYTLQGVAADFFTVAGAAQAGNSPNSGVVTAVFPKTDGVIPISMFQFLWDGEHGGLAIAGGGEVTVETGKTLTIAAQDAGYTIYEWHLDGADTGQKGKTFDFMSAIIGEHTVGLFVEKDGKLYNANIIITVAQAAKP
jgi:uncharacterized protein YegP (UPF0339 family)